MQGGLVCLRSKQRISQRDENSSRERWADGNAIRPPDKPFGGNILHKKHRNTLS